MTYTWDSDNKLRSADIDANGTVDVNFQYDALGRRVARSGTGGSLVFVQMDQQTIADYPVGGAATTPTFRYVYASYIDEPVVRKTAGTGGTLVYFHRNHQYSITAITTSAGAISERYAYTAYGQPTILNASGTPLSPQTSTLNSRYSYTGREWDATLGLHHFRARWMSPSAGRFLRRDPIGYFGSEWNLYEDVGGQILSFVDPLGLYSINFCDNLLEEIKNLIKEIKKRQAELREDPLGLPECHPDDDLKPSKSKRGHRRLINQHKANLANKVGKYLARCGDLPDDVLPLPIDVPVQVVEPEQENPVIPLIPYLIPEPMPAPNPPTPSIPPIRPWWGWPNLGLPIFPLWLAPPPGDPNFA